jgi:glycosyltransferase involved in cell wall biosynthesis
MRLDIGLMPLPDDPWTQGKGGFKALQYLALEIPAVVSPVGINQEIVIQGMNGYLAVTDEEWLDSISRLIEDKSLRVRLGQAGRRHVEAHYSVEVVAPVFLKLFA